MDEYIITLPVVLSASFSVNPVETGGNTMLTVTVGEETRIRYPEERCSGEFYAGDD